MHTFRDEIILPISTALNARLNLHLSTPAADVSAPLASRIPETVCESTKSQCLIDSLCSHTRAFSSLSWPVTDHRPVARRTHRSAAAQGRGSDTSGMRVSAQRRLYVARALSFLSGNVQVRLRVRITHKLGTLGLDQIGSDFDERCADAAAWQWCVSAGSAVAAAGRSCSSPGGGGLGRVSRA